MKRALSEAFARYGMSVSVLHGGETAETKAFLQLVKRENGEEPFSVTALGAVDEQCWRYLGPEDVKIAMGDFVQCGEGGTSCARQGPFYVGEGDRLLLGDAASEGGRGMTAVGQVKRAVAAAIKAAGCAAIESYSEEQLKRYATAVAAVGTKGTVIERAARHSIWEKRSTRRRRRRYLSTGEKCC
ncbi:MAG: hypothetical protein ACLTG0_15135 [Oscillibacter sp.]